MNKKLKFITLLGVLALASCGNSGSGENGGGSTPGGTTSRDEQKETIIDKWWTNTGEIIKNGDGSIDFDEVTIKLSTVVSGEDLSVFEEIIQTFNNEYSGRINVQATSINQTQFEETVSGQISQDINSPDLIMSHQKGHRAFATAKLIRPFDDVVEESGITLDVKRDYVNGLSKYSDLNYAGYTFGVPADMQSVVVYYNKAILNELNLELPTSRSEFLEACKAFKQTKGGYPIAWDSEEVFFKNYVAMTSFAQNGVQYYKNDKYVDWSNSDNMNAITNGLDAMRELATLGYANMSMSGSVANNNFCQDKALFYFYMPWNANTLFESFRPTHGNVSISQIKSDYVGGYSMAGLFAKDASKDYSQRIFGDSHFFALTKTCEDFTKQAAALTFVKWFTENGEIGAQWAEAGHGSASTIITSSNEYTDNEFVSDYISAFYPDSNAFITAGNNEYYKEVFTDGLFRVFVELKDKTDSSNDESVIRRIEGSVNEMIEFLEDE